MNKAKIRWGINTKQTGKTQQTLENICQDYPI